MTTVFDARAFPENARAALQDDQLQVSLARIRAGFQYRRRSAVDSMPGFDAMRDEAVRVKNAVIADLATHLETFEARVVANGGRVHWARDAREAREIILGICRMANAKLVAKGKSMIGEEIAINAALEEAGIAPVETDLGEYIVQLRHEPPSHIIAPAFHLNRKQVAESFRAAHEHLDPDRDLDDRKTLIAEARQVLRQVYLDADVGITGANFLVAETGSVAVVTNEGNGDLTMTCPRVHIALASIEKVVPTLDDLALFLRLLARSATGQEMSAYTTLRSGPRKPGEADGPDEFHVVLLDNGRSALIGTPAQEVLRCIRCGACMNHCPVYSSVGGHAYGAIYPGPIGAALDPAIYGVGETQHLPNASTFCGRCEAVCPVRIPLPKIMRHWRAQAFEQHAGTTTSRLLLRLWAWFAMRPRLYRVAIRLASIALRIAGGTRGRTRHLPLAGGWTSVRDLPTPVSGSFVARAQRRRK